MKLTKEEVQKKSQDKVNAIETLCKQLEIVVSAEQIITQQGFIKHIVYYTDTEKYDMVERPNQKGNEPKNPQDDAGAPTPSEEDGGAEEQDEAPTPQQ